MAENTHTSKTRKIWPRADVIALLSLLVAVIIGFLTIPELRQLVGLDPHATSSLENVESLAPGVNISVYEDEFGKPTFINHPQSLTTKTDENEYIFVNTDFYLDAITDIHDSVLYFALTVRTESFHPVFKGPAPITLGVSKFTDITGYPEHVVACTFAGPKFSYYETHYYGFGGDYQDFGFGVNPAGYVSSDLSDLPELDHKGYCPLSPNYVTTPDMGVLKNLRSNTIINTYAVSTGQIQDQNASLFLGVDYDQVHLLNP